MPLPIKDPWKILRAKLCFGNVEPSVELIAKTEPLGDIDIEELPALSASVSYGSEIKGITAEKRLNCKLIEMGHLTPLESVSFNFHISGISKICGAQLSRHRIGQGHVSGSRRFRKQEPHFVYPLLNYIVDEGLAHTIYSIMSLSAKDSFERYSLWMPSQGVKKADARYLIPASTATERNWFINARALRDFFRLRLAPDAEWEIRRLAFLVLSIVHMVTPSLFEDIYEHYYINTNLVDTI